MSGINFDAAFRMIARSFRPGGTASNQIKNTGTALDYVRGLDRNLFTDLVEHGDGALDHSAIIRELLRHNVLPLH